MDYDDYELSEKLKNMMWKFPVESKEYKLAQSAFAKVCERIREKMKVETKLVFPPPKIGSMEEKMGSQAEEIYLAA